MNSLLTVPSPSSPSASSFSSKRSKPLSTHGMPKEPLPSPGQPHRFSRMDASMSPPITSPALPMSPQSPMSPPMSAKSFGTFIDSEPSTPAYSPRMGSNWDGSTLVLLSPVSIGSKSPKEPAWEMMAPPAPKPKKKATITKTTPFPLIKEISTTTSLSSHPLKRTTEEEVQKENVSPAEGEVEEDTKGKEESSLSIAPLNKLATRMKHMLRRKSAGEKSERAERKSEKRRREYEDVDRLEDLHWTEM